MMNTIHHWCGVFASLPPYSGITYLLAKNSSRYNFLKISFCSRVDNIWNSLTDSVADADMINTVKSHLDKHWNDQEVIYNFYSEITGTGSASICMFTFTLEVPQWL